MPIPTIPPSTEPSLQAYTVTYSENVQGFPSFYSYIPEQIQGLNQYLYTFKNGSMYRHNTKLPNKRGVFYGDFTSSKVQSIINIEPTTVKVFKTIELESDDSWGFAGQTDLESGNIDDSYFELKEGSYFSYIRGIDSVPVLNNELALRSAQGIGAITSVDASTPSAIIITYAANVLDSMLSIGDLFYFVQSNVTVLGGKITAVNLTNNTITVDSTITGGGSGMLATNYSFYIKNAVAESHGLRGYYLEFVVENDNRSKVELFTLSSDVMKSFP